MTSWIFQGNPRDFRIDEYLLNRKNINWTLNQMNYYDEISPNDEVYIWRADGDIPKSGGIVAKGKIAGIPQEIQDDAPDFWINKKPKSSVVLRVPIEIEEVRLNKDKGMLMRVDLEKDDVVKDMRILRVRTQTNYKLEPKHSEYIYKLWEQKRMK